MSGRRRVQSRDPRAAQAANLRLGMGLADWVPNAAVLRRTPPKLIRGEGRGQCLVHARGDQQGRLSATTQGRTWPVLALSIQMLTRLAQSRLRVYSLQGTCRQLLLSATSCRALVLPTRYTEQAAGTFLGAAGQLMLPAAQLTWNSKWWGLRDRRT